MKRILVFLTLASCALAGTWLASPGKGSHAAAAGGPTFIGSAENSEAPATASIATSTGLTVGAGNLVLCLVTYGNTVGTCTGVSVDGQAMTLLDTVSNNTNDFQVDLWYLENASADASAVVTATFSFASAFRSIIAANWSGVATASANDGFSSFPASTYTGEPNSGVTSRTATDITTANANNLLVNIWINWDGPQVNSAATNWTLRSSSSSSFLAITDRVVSSTGSYPAANTGTVPVGDGYVSMFSAWKGL